MTNYADLYNPKKTPQSEPMDERQVQNNAGGFVFALDIWARLDRFLILGSDAPTYYQSAQKLTRENAKVVEQCYAEDPDRTVTRIVEVSYTGRAPKNDAAIFALALGAVHPDVRVRTLVYQHMNLVCRIGTHIFQFVDTCRKLGKGWGRGMRRAVGEWYEHREVDRLAFQAIKYRNRENYTHKRLIQCTHPTGAFLENDGPPGEEDPWRAALYRWIVEKDYSEDFLPRMVWAHLKAMNSHSVPEIIGLIKEYNLPWEALPTWALPDPQIWRALLPKMGLTAMIRELGRMTENGAIKPLTKELQIVTERLADQDQIRKARVHPFTILQALAVYKNGGGRSYGGFYSVRTTRSWDPISQIVDALDEAFYLAFQNVEPTGKNHLLGIDVSGSMDHPLNNSPLTVREGAAAMALVTMATEPMTHTMGFTSGSGRSGGWGYSRMDTRMTSLDISPKQRLDKVVRTISRQDFGGTDCALPMIYATERKLDVDAFVVYTDNETWAGRIHPVQALKEYRKKSGRNAKLVVVGMTSTGFSIADPTDGGMLDVVGFDSAAPAVIADFLRN